VDVARRPDPVTGEVEPSANACTRHRIDSFLIGHGHKRFAPGGTHPPIVFTVSELGDGVVTLRPWAHDDAPALAEALDGDPEISRWLDLIPQPYSVIDAHAYISSSGEEKYAVTEAESGRVLGSIAISWNPAGDNGEIGYWLRSDARGRGVMTRALKLVARHALEAGAARVQLRADPENVASCRVAEKAGFTREGVLRSVYWNERLGRRQDHALFSLLPGELD
jgi:RimJ/RimL family protein N-acetyltransferase